MKMTISYIITMLFLLCGKCFSQDSTLIKNNYVIFNCQKAKVDFLDSSDVLNIKLDSNDISLSFNISYKIIGDYNNRLKKKEEEYAQWKKEVSEWKEKYEKYENTESDSLLKAIGFPPAIKEAPQKITPILIENFIVKIVSFTQKDSEKKVALFFMCRDKSVNMEHEIVYISDAGDCYFRININLTKNKGFIMVGTGVQLTWD